ncbi:hypothetical protein ACP70R_046084 [Stipagrostis hirtigluma subsp. patula]
MLVDNALDMLSKQVEEKISVCASAYVDSSTVRADNIAPNELLSNARLKQKEVRTKSSKRTRTWLDKKPKSRKKGHSKSILKEKNSVQVTGKEADDDGARAEEGDGVASMDKGNESQEYNALNYLSFTQLLTGPMTGDLDAGYLF